MGEAEALAMTNESELDGRAGRLIEQALALDPNSGKALFFGAAAAVRRGQLALGQERFQKILSMNPPQGIRPILQQQIDGLDRKLGGGRLPMATSTCRRKPSSRSCAPQIPTPRCASTSSSLPHLSQGTPDAATPLFVFVRDPGQPGPPLAAKRLAAVSRRMWN